MRVLLLEGRRDIPAVGERAPVHGPQRARDGREGGDGSGRLGGSLTHLPFVAGIINEAHRQVQFHGRSMLMEAKAAGEALLFAKGLVKHGEFKAWVEANCRCSYETARQYLRVAKVAEREMVEVHQFDGGIRAFLEAHSTPRKRPADARSSSAPAFTQDDAEHALKLARMASSANENEAEVAQTKLDRFAEGFGMTGEEAQAKAEKMLPEPVALLDTQTPSARRPGAFLRRSGGSAGARALAETARTAAKAS